MISESIKALINAKREDAIYLRYIDDNDLVELVNYMVANNSVVTSLALTESSITKNGIDVLADRYGSKICNLNLSDNDIADNDVTSISSINFPVLKRLRLNNTCITETSIEVFRRMNLEYLEIDGSIHEVQHSNPVPMHAAEPDHPEVIVFSSTGRMATSHTSSNSTPSYDLLTNVERASSGSSEHEHSAATGKPNSPRVNPV